MSKGVRIYCSCVGRRGWEHDQGHGVGDREERMDLRNA